MIIDKRTMPRSLAEYIFVQLGGHSVYHYQTTIVKWMDKVTPTTKPSERCAVCGDSAPARGLFQSLDASVPAPICFACVFVHTLKGCRCHKCGAESCSGFLTYEVTDMGRIAPVPLCPNCLPEPGDEFEAVCDTNRNVIPEANA